VIVAVVGGRGRVGSAVVTELRTRGHEARVLGRSSREHPVDLTTGAGLDAALAGAAVVVNAVNDPKGGEALVDGTRRLLEAEADAGVRHHVEIGVVGADRVPLAYYRAKVHQEAAVRGSEIPWTVVRSTQFHDFLAWAFAAAARKHVLPSGRVPLQPAAVEEVAAVIADVGEREASRSTVTVAGPRAEALADLASAWRRAAHVRALAVPVPGVSRATRALRAGHLVPAGAPDATTTTTFAAWLDRN
jgi:uncharacterized protein YbjT (DUF2867 family)